MGNRLKSVAIIACLKTFLMIFNIVFWISGLCLIAIGLWAEAELHKYLELSGELSWAAPGVLAGVPGVLVGVGALVLFACSLACTCTIRGQPVLLYTYGGVLCVVCVLLLGVQMSVVSGALRDPAVAAVTGPPGVGLQASLARGLNTSLHREPKALDFLQSQLHCCGVLRYSDWLSVLPPRTPPSSCCRISPCLTTDTHHIYTQGCYTVITQLVENNQKWIWLSGVGAALLPLLGLILSCCLANQINKAHKYHNENVN